MATSATPNEIKQLFRNCRIIGRRFRLAHIFFGPKIIETSTFRANPRGDEDVDDASELLIRRDNVFGSDTEDARRRDFTINGLFYNVETEEVIDHVGGLRDLDARLIRTIGEPGIRFQEDPVRMLRAIKFAARLGFDIEETTLAALIEHRGEINKCAPPRVIEEVYRLLRGGAATRSMELLLETGLAAVLSPQLAALFSDAGDDDVDDDFDTSLDTDEVAWAATWDDERMPAAAHLELDFLDRGELEARRAVAWNVLRELDQLKRTHRELSNALLLAAIVNPFLYDSLTAASTRPADANEMIAVLGQPLFDELRVARRDTERIRQILMAQRRLAPSRRRRSRPMTMVKRDFFADAVSVYEVTARASNRDSDEVEYWRKLADREESDEDSRSRKQRRRRRGGRRRRRDEDGELFGDDEDEDDEDEDEDEEDDSRHPAVTA